MQRFFVERLVRQLRASPHTVAGYRDTFRLLFRFAEASLGRKPSELDIEDLDVNLVGQFLDYLEEERKNSPRSRNTRLAALRGFFHYVAFSEPSYGLLCQRVLAIPTKRYERRLVAFLSAEETAALLAAPNPSMWLGRRDRTLLLVALQTGLRVSELTSLKRRDVEFGRSPYVRCVGKGRKTRCTPLCADVAKLLSLWLAEEGGQEDAPVFRSSRTGPLSADAVQRLVARHVKAASKTCPALASRKITPHTLRHTAAMNLLRSGVDLTVIALWLGHESTETTQVYLHADMELKERALARSTASGIAPATFRASDPLLAFLESL
jgi:site-specific recombinase XerD